MFRCLEFGSSLPGTSREVAYEHIGHSIQFNIICIMRILGFFPRGGVPYISALNRLTTLNDYLE